MQPPFSPVLYAVLLFLGMLIMLEVGRRIAARVLRPGVKGDEGSYSTVEAAVLALFGLMIAFAFSGAASRFQEKRMLVAEEANAVETAYMRIDLVDQQVQPELREQFRQYVDARLEMYRRLPDMKAAAPAMDRAKRLQGDIWKTAIAATRRSVDDPAGARLLLPAVNDMIDVTTTRMVALQNHPPTVVYGLMFLLGLLCALLAGFRMASWPVRSWLHVLVFPLVTASVVYVTIDVEYPRVGLIRLDQADNVLAEVRAKME